MAEFTIILEGKADPDAVREAFEIAVRAIREALEEAGLSGELTLDDVPYPADDVTDVAAADVTEEGEDDADGGESDDGG